MSTGEPVPQADRAEQERPVREQPDPATTGSVGDLPDDVPEADALEQRLEVPDEPEDERA